ncbi:MAG: DUF433 domain-containing protein [Bacteroidia bacterium]
MNWQEYIVSNKDILLGKPSIKGTSISVELILELLASGWSETAILESYPNLTKEALQAVFAYLKDCVQQEFYFPMPKTA